MKILLTGACGFVGPYLSKALLAAGHQVYGTVFGSESSDDQLISEANLFSCDLQDSKSIKGVVEKCQPEGVFHLAGISFVPEANSDFQKTLSVNVGGTFNLLNALKELNKEIKVIVVSSGDVYGKVRPSDLPISEQCQAKPANNYSLTKVLVEELVGFFNSDSKLRISIARPFNHIGPGQDSRFVVASFAEQVARIKLGKQKPVLRVGNLSARRDFTDVRDIVRGYLSMLKTDPGLYNLCSGTSVSIQSILDQLIQLGGVEVEVKTDPERLRPSDVPEIKGDFSLINSKTGWKPTISLNQSLGDILEQIITRESS